MKDSVKALAITWFILIPFLIPVSNVVTIETKDINSIRPFAGTINNNIVGTTLACKYAFSYDEELPTIATYNVIKPAILQYLGYVYTCELITFEE